MKNIVIIDNILGSYGNQIYNGIPIIPYFDNKEDNELSDLLLYLKSLKEIPDVREYNRKVFEYDLFEKSDSREKLIEHITKPSNTEFNSQFL